MKLFRKQTPCYIFSVYCKDLKGNNERHADTVKMLESDGVAFKVVHGRFHGATELTFVVPEQSLRDGLAATLRRYVQQIAQEHHQAVILYLDEYRTAYFISPYTGCMEEAGKWVAVRNARDDEDHTYDPETKQFFVIRSHD